DPTGDATPLGGLIQAADGNLYGTTLAGGAFGFGQIYNLAPDGSFAVVYSFDNGPEGIEPMAPLLQASDGNLYGTTSSGGISNWGALFKMTPDGTVTTLHQFSGGMDGKRPAGGVVQASDGNLYGTTQVGGAFDRGTVFQMTLKGAVTIVHHF